MNAQPLDSFTAVIGIDWGDTKHDVCIQPSAQGNRALDCSPHPHARTNKASADLSSGLTDIVNRLDETGDELHRIGNNLPGANFPLIDREVRAGKTTPSP